MGLVPAPVVVSPSGQFDGIDGNWSSFTIRVGDPAQNVRVLASTLVPETWVVQPLGCDLNSPPGCRNSRGGFFDPASSKSWSDQSTWSLAVESGLGILPTAAGSYGYDTLGVTSAGRGGLTLEHQVVAAIALTDVWVGNLGLAPRTPNFNNQNQTSFLKSLYNQTLIPSLSFSYTAGAYYRNRTLGSLTLGGYDTSRFTPNDVSFPISPVFQRELLLGLQSITYSDSSVRNIPLLPTGIFTLIDSTLPNIWLPQEACDVFAAVFGLQYQPNNLHYTINDTMHAQNLQNNASVTFVLGSNIQGGRTVSVNLPYPAFDLYWKNVHAPSANASRYFPIQVASYPAQYTLGRAFLQEAVLTVDYGRQNFTVAQALPVTSSTQSHLVAIPDVTTGSGSDPASSPSPSPGPGPGPGSGSGGGPSTSGTDPPSQPSSSIGAGAIAGIVVAVVIMAILALGTFWFVRRRKRRNAAANAGAAAPSEKPNLPELPGYSTQPDYFALQAKTLAESYSKPGPTVITARPHELPSPSAAVELITPVQTPATELVGSGVPQAEMAGIAHESDVEDHDQPAAAVRRDSHRSGLSHSTLTPTLEPWSQGTQLELHSPQESLMSAMSIGMRYPGRANIVDARDGRPRRRNSDRSPVDQSGSAFQSPILGATHLRDEDEDGSVQRPQNETRP